MKPSLIIVDMLKDTFENHPDSYIVKKCQQFIPKLNKFIDFFHDRKLPVIFACDSFLQKDFIFSGRMKPHSIRNTRGAEPIDELKRADEDILLPKRRFSAFYKTDLDQTLRTLDVDTVFISGIATHVCVLTTALDAISYDFRAIIMQQCCAAHSENIHEAIISVYEKTPLYPLLQVLDNNACWDLLKSI